MRTRNASAAMERRQLERLQYAQGQQLRSRDFRDLAEIEDQLRWWHNRSLHEIPGVRRGLDVKVAPTTITISPGIAYDGYGRELLHARETILSPLPDLPTEGLILVVQRSASRPAGNFSPASCPPSTTGSSLNTLEFLWLENLERNAPHGVPLGRLYREIDKSLHFDPQRSYTRPLARPRMANGSTIPGATDWELWQPLEDGLVLGLQVWIDAATAGFTRPPCYFAWLQAKDWLAAHTLRQGWLGLMTVEYIDEISVHGFTFRLTAAEPMGVDYCSLLQQAKPYVCWLGIEPVWSEKGDEQ